MFVLLTHEAVSDIMNCVLDDLRLQEAVIMSEALTLSHIKYIYL